MRMKVIIESWVSFLVKYRRIVSKESKNENSMWIDRSKSRSLHSHAHSKTHRQSAEESIQQKKRKKQTMNGKVSSTISDKCKYDGSSEIDYFKQSGL